MKNAVSQLKKVGIVNNAKPITHFFVNANDPDEACSQAMVQLKNRIMSEKKSSKVMDLLEEIQFDIRITKVRAVKPLDR